MTLQFPPGFLVRPATLDDIATFTTFIRFCQQRELGSARTTEEDTRILWTSPEMDLPHDTWLVFSSSDQILDILNPYACR